MVYEVIDIILGIGFVMVTGVMAFMIISQVQEQRKQQAMLMIQQHHHAEMNQLGKYRVRSQKDSNKWYNVLSTGNV